jgi:riboflavin synthase
MVANGRFGGHIVLGHVDAVGEIVSPVPQLIVRVPQGLMRYIVEKGSCTVDGISLTVAEVSANSFSVWLIPHTWEVTNLHQRRLGDSVNLEFDMLAKYVEKLLSHRFPVGYPLAE